MSRQACAMSFDKMEPEPLKRVDIHVGLRLFEKKEGMFGMQTSQAIIDRFTPSMFQFQAIYLYDIILKTCYVGC